MKFINLLSTLNSWDESGVDQLLKCWLKLMQSWANLQPRTESIGCCCLKGNAQEPHHWVLVK